MHCTNTKASMAVKGEQIVTNIDQVFDEVSSNRLQAILAHSARRYTYIYKRRVYTHDFLFARPSTNTPYSILLPLRVQVILSAATFPV